MKNPFIRGVRFISALIGGVVLWQGCGPKDNEISCDDYHAEVANILDPCRGKGNELFHGWGSAIHPTNQSLYYLVPLPISSNFNGEDFRPMCSSIVKFAEPGDKVYPGVFIAVIDNPAQNGPSPTRDFKFYPTDPPGNPTAINEAFRIKNNFEIIREYTANCTAGALLP